MSTQQNGSQFGAEQFFRAISDAFMKYYESLTWEGAGKLILALLLACVIMWIYALFFRD